MLEAFNRDDADRVVAAFVDDCVLHEPPEMPDRPPLGFRGHDGIREWMQKLRGTADVRFEMHGHTVTGEVIVAEWTAAGRGHASGVPINWSTFAVVHMRDRKIATAQGFLTMTEALEAAGVGE